MDTELEDTIKYYIYTKNTISHEPSYIQMEKKTNRASFYAEIVTGVSEWLLFNINSAISWREQVNFEWDDDEVRFVLDQHA